MTGLPRVGHGLLCFRPCPGGLGLSFWGSPSCLLGGGPCPPPSGSLVAQASPAPSSYHAGHTWGPSADPQWGSGDPLQHPQGREGGGVDGGHRGHGGKGRGPAWTRPQLRGSLGVLSTQPVWPRDSVGGQERQEPSERPGGQDAFLPHVRVLPCRTLGDPVDCSPPGSSSMGFPGETTGAGCHSSSIFTVANSVVVSYLQVTGSLCMVPVVLRSHLV